ncbi:MAG: 50S ribosomal protein L9 [Chloroflexota bacterium]
MPKVIFLEDVPPNARAGDVKEVKPGYARNFLLPRNLATIATPGELKRVDKLRKEAAIRHAEEANEWRDVAQQLSEASIIITVRSGPRGRLYGSVTSHMVADKLSEIAGQRIDRRGVHIPTPIRQLGEHRISVRYFPEVEGEVTINVVSADGGAEAAEMERVVAEAEAATQEEQASRDAEAQTDEGTEAETSEEESSQ